MDAIRQHGARRRPIFADPVTEHLIKTQFTWSYLCDMLEENENWEQKRWCEAFDLAASIHADLLEIEVPDKVRGLLDTVTKPVAVPYDREIRIAKLRTQGRAILEEKGVD